MKETDKLLQAINDGQLGEALRIIDANPQFANDDTQQIKADYQLMLHYMEQGYNDPERQQLYKKLLDRLYTIAANRHIANKIATHPLMLATRNRVRVAGTNWSVAHIRSRLEAFVMDIAVAELQQTPTEQIYDQHLQLQTDLFDYIITSKIWTSSVADAFTEMLLTPTIDRIDQLLIASAITVSCIETYDPQKSSLLAKVAQQTTDIPLRQRSLVGWALSLPMVSENSPENETGEQDISRSPLLSPQSPFLQGLTEMQMQLAYCVTAKQDNQTIREEILPTLMKNNPLRFRTDGQIEEIDKTDDLDEVLHPDEAERNLEQAEQSMQRMTDMQQQGADVFFGGFSQMKRFPFFLQTANWLMPFYKQHPGIRHVVEQMQGNPFLECILASNNFCDSDKYSFTLAAAQVWQRMPDNIKEALIGSLSSMGNENGGQSLPLTDDASEAAARSSLISRRSYLQDLYRFYTLHQNKQLFSSPFAPDPENGSTPKWLFLANPIFRGTPMEQHIVACAKLLYKKGLEHEALALLENCTEKTKDYQYHILKGAITHSAQDYERALELRPDDEHALRGAARAHFANGAYAQAAERYEKLAQMQPEKTAYQLNLAICQAHNQQLDAALDNLYRLHFEQEDNRQVKAALAWGLMQNRQYEKANAIYDAQPDLDPFNAAICQWVTGNVGRAVQLFRQTKQAAQAIDQEQPNLMRHGLTKLDITMMKDLILGT